MSKWRWGGALAAFAVGLILFALAFGLYLTGSREKVSFGVVVDAGSTHTSAILFKMTESDPILQQVIDCN